VKGIYSNGDEKNLTQSATTSAATPTSCSAERHHHQQGRTLAVGVGVATISASFSGVTTTATGGDARIHGRDPADPDRDPHRVDADAHVHRVADCDRDAGRGLDRARARVGAEGARDVPELLRERDVL
jgi:hypothetical protein